MEPRVDVVSWSNSMDKIGAFRLTTLKDGDFDKIGGFITVYKENNESFVRFLDFSRGFVEIETGDDVIKVEIIINRKEREGVDYTYDMGSQC